MLNKDTDIAVYKTALEQATIASRSVFENASILDKKANIMLGYGITVAIVLASCIYGLILMDIEKANLLYLTFGGDIYANIKWVIFPPPILLFFGVVVSVICLLCAFKSRKYYLEGNLMEDFEKDDEFFHDEKGIHIFLIAQCKERSEFNCEINRERGGWLTWSIVSTTSALFVAGIWFILGLLLV